MKGKDNMRKSNLWFVAALVSMLWLVVGLPLLIGFVHQSITLGRIPTENLNSVYGVALAGTVFGILVAIASAMMIRTDPFKWALTVIIFLIGGYIASFSFGGSYDDDPATLYFSLSSLVWLVGGVTILMPLLRERYEQPAP